MTFSTFLHGWLEKCIEIINIKFIYIIGFPVFPWVIPNQYIENFFINPRSAIINTAAMILIPLLR